MSRKLSLVLLAIVIAGVAFFVAQRSASKDQAPKQESAAPAYDAAAPKAKSLLQPQADDVILGDKGAPVTLIEYASLSCPHCAHFHNDVLPELQKRYIDSGKMRLIHRPFPLNEPALRAAMVTFCGGPEKYHAFLKTLFAQQEQWAFDPDFKQRLGTIASIGGLSGDAYAQCIADSQIEAKILTIRKEAAEVLKIESTPTFFLNGEKYAGAMTVEALGARIEALLAQ